MEKNIYFVCEELWKKRELAILENCEYMIPVHLEKVDRQTLKIVWDDGEASYYPLEFLRRKCPCASCGEARHAKPAQANPFRILQPQEIISNDLNLQEAAAVGRYALHFKWSDGHGEGIYTFDFLRELAGEEACRRMKAQHEKKE